MKRLGDLAPREQDAEQLDDALAGPDPWDEDFGDYLAATFADERERARDEAEEQAMEEQIAESYRRAGAMGGIESEYLGTWRRPS